MFARRTISSFFRRLLTRCFRRTRPIRRNRLDFMQLEAREVPAYLGGVSLAVGDVNGDGFLDVITGQASKGAPLVRVIDGATGNLGLEFFAYEQSFTGGVYVAAGDIDADGIDEIITGTGNGGGPNVQVFDGRTGKARFGFFPYEDAFRGGVIVAAADTDGDGKAEIICGTGIGGGPRVQAFDAATRNPLINFFAYESSFRGGVLVGAGDLTGDGKDEILTGTGPGGGPVVTAFQAGSTESFVRFLAADGAFRGGVAVTGADMTGDGKAEFITGTGPGINSGVGIFSPDGATNLVSFAPFDVASFPAKAISAKASTEPSFSTLPFSPTVGLSVSTPTVMAGKNQQLVFTAKSGSTSIPTEVKLYEADAAGTPGAFLLNLFDDGAFTHRDVTAKDGTFANIFTVNFTAPADKFYAAKVTVDGKTETFTTKVSGVAAPSGDTVVAQSTQAAALQSTVTSKIAAGTPVATALADAKASLAGNAALARPDSITQSGAGLSWLSPEGIRMHINANVGSNTFEKDPSSGGGGSSGDGSTSGHDGTNHDCKGKAIVLAPYFSYFESKGGDESNDIAASLRAKGYDVTERYDAAVTIDDYKGLGKYDAVVFSSHGDSAADGSNQIYLTNIKADLAGIIANFDDLVAGRMDFHGDTFVLTPSFFSYYNGQMNDTMVYMSICRGGRSAGFASAFLNSGADTFAGYSDYVATTFAVSHGVNMFNHLLGGGKYNGIPGIGDTEPATDPSPARFRVWSNAADGKLEPDCDLLRDYDLAVTYTWPTTQRDLDTGTLFLGSAVGYSCGSSKYMTFTGDDTTAGGSETATVKLYESFTASGWTTTVDVAARAGWYSPAKGAGPATVTVSLKHKTTGELKHSVQRSINPGSQSGCATTVVGMAVVTVEGEAGQERVSFTFA